MSTTRKAKIAEIRRRIKSKKTELAKLTTKLQDAKADVTTLATQISIVCRLLKSDQTELNAILNRLPNKELARRTKGAQTIYSWSPGHEDNLDYA